MFRLICVVIGYFIGCIQSAYFVGKFMKVDIREHGSGNLGSTNALRVLGKKAGAITFAGDVLKSILGFVICSIIFKENSQIAGFYGCVGVILGHDYPFYLKFKGGKGIACMIGMMMCSGSLAVTLITYAIGALGLTARYVSLGSILLSISIPIVLWIFGYNYEVIIITLCLSALAIYRHRANIKRLMAGTESKLGAKK